VNNLTLQHIVLRDEGTLDTVVECECPLCEEEIEMRFSQEHRQSYGDDITLMATEEWELHTCGIDH
jgi:hypothetical protein